MLAYSKVFYWRLCINVCAAAIYFFVAFHFDFPSNIKDTLFSSPDSKEYSAMGDWMFHADGTTCSSTRPFLFPALVHVSYLLGGMTGVWLMNFIFYLCSVNLVFSAVRNLSGLFFAVIAVLIMLVNPGLIAITFHALTEAASFFLLSLLAWVISKRYERENEALFWRYFFLPLALLAVIKPYFAFPFYLSLVLFAFRAVKRKELRTGKMLLRVFIYCFPVLLQFGIMFSQFGKFKLSTIGEVTLRNYYYSKFYADKHGISYDLEVGPTDSCQSLVRQKVAGASESEMLRDIFSSPVDAFGIYFGVIRLNLISPSDLQMKAQYRSERLDLYSYHTNVRYFRIHQFILMVLALFLWLTRKQQEKWVPAFVLLFFELLIIGVSGISYWQGDRLVLPALPLWITLYTYLLYECFRALRHLRGGLHSEYHGSSL
ncbi:MAG TPA: hypothetical protein VI112_04180 [Bacteroidia bacterium]|jgi:4-amino-4-deoxy-L-arabinose transferase-like glycosyltransferase